MFHRPGAKRRREIGAADEFHRTRGRDLDRAADPETAAGGRIQGLLAIEVVAQYAAAPLTPRRLARRPPAQLLEAGDVRRPLAVGLGEIVEPGAVIEGEGADLGPRPRPVGRPVDVAEALIVAQTAVRAALVEEIPELHQARDRRGAAVTRDDDGAAGVGGAATILQSRARKPAMEEAGHERIAGAEHVEDLDVEAGAGDAVLDGPGNGALEDDAAHRPALDHQHPIAEPAQAPERRHRVGGAAGDVDLFFRADDEVAVRNDRLQMLAYRGAFDEAFLAEPMAGQAPQHGPVIEVERHLGPGGPGMGHRRARGAVHPRGREMGAAEEKRLGRGDEVAVEIALLDRHVGAVLAIEDQREGVAVANAEDDERGQALRIGLDVAGIDAFRFQGLADEATHMFVADTGDERRLQPQPG